MRVIYALFVAVLTLAACEPTNAPIGRDGKPVQGAYRIRSGDTAKLQYRMLDSVNALRSAQGVAPLQMNAQLNAAAATHSRDMSLQNRPWHFGSDGSSPIDRLARVGYPGILSGETISESYESELETLGAWMSQADTRRTILAPQARDMGFSWFQEKNGKIWWTLVLGDPTTAPLIPSANPAASRLVPGHVDTPETDGIEPEEYETSSPNA